MAVTTAPRSPAGRTTRGTGLVAVVGREELTAFVGAALESAGARAEDADLTAQVLVAADAAGAGEHGVVRLGPCVRGLLDGSIDGRARPEIVHRYGAVTVVDAHRGLGQPTLAFAVDRALEQARDHGSAMVSVRRSRHVGATDWYSERAARVGAFGIITSSGPGSGTSGRYQPGAESSQLVMCVNQGGMAAPYAGGPPCELSSVSPSSASPARTRLCLPVGLMEELARVAALVKVTPVTDLDRRRSPRPPAPRRSAPALPIRDR